MHPPRDPRRSVAKGVKVSHWCPQHMAFTTADAVATFKEHTGIEFHPTAPGQFLARAGVHQCGTDKQNRATYPREAWFQLWRDMVWLARRRARFDASTSVPEDLQNRPPSIIRCA